MFTNKAADGANNICSGKIQQLRLERRWSQRKLAEKLQESGLDVDKNAIQRLESGKRFLTDIEMAYIARLFNVSVSDLYPDQF